MSDEIEIMPGVFLVQPPSGRSPHIAPAAAAAAAAATSLSSGRAAYAPRSAAGDHGDDGTGNGDDDDDDDGADGDDSESRLRDVNQLVFDIDVLERAVTHLIASNDELKDALVEDPDDAVGHAAEHSRGGVGGGGARQ